MIIYTDLYNHTNHTYHLVSCVRSHACGSDHNNYLYTISGCNDWVWDHLCQCWWRLWDCLSVCGCTWQCWAHLRGDYSFLYCWYHCYRWLQQPEVLITFMYDCSVVMCKQYCDPHLQLVIDYSGTESILTFYGTITRHEVKVPVMQDMFVEGMECFHSNLRYNSGMTVNVIPACSGHCKYP